MSNITMPREVAEQALDALKNGGHLTYPGLCKAKAAGDALEAALAASTSPVPAVPDAPKAAFDQKREAQNASADELFDDQFHKVRAYCSRDEYRSIYRFITNRIEEIIAGDSSEADATHRTAAVPDAAKPAEPDMRTICEALGFDPTNHHNAAKCPYCRPAEAAKPEPPTPHGELDPRSAIDTARKMLRYVDSFNSQPWGGVDESVDRKNLAVALDNLQETAAMLLNVSDRLAAKPETQGERAIWRIRYYGSPDLKGYNIYAFKNSVATHGDFIANLGDNGKVAEALCSAHNAALLSAGPAEDRPKPVLHVNKEGEVFCVKSDTEALAMLEAAMQTIRERNDWKSAGPARVESLTEDQVSDGLASHHLPQNFSYRQAYRAGFNHGIGKDQA